MAEEGIRRIQELFAKQAAKSTEPGADEPAQNSTPFAPADSAVPPVSDKPINGNGYDHEAENARKAGIYEWERQLADLVGLSLKREPDISEDRLVLDIIGLVLEEPDSGWQPPPWLNMTPSEVEGSIVKTITEIVKAREAAKPKPKEDVEEKIQVLNLTDLYSIIDEWERRPWVMDGILPHASLSLIVGKSETGKSTIIYALIHAIATGAEFFGRQCEQGRIVYLAGDPMSEVVAGKTFRNLGLTEGITVVPGALAANSTGMEQLRRLVEREKPSLVVADTLAATILIDVDKYGQSYHAQQPLSKIARDFGPNFLMSHHSQKSAIDSYSVIDAALGSVGVAAVASTRMATKLHRRKGEKFFTFEMSNLRIGRPIEGEWIVEKNEATGLVSLSSLMRNRKLSLDKDLVIAVLMKLGTVAKRTLWSEMRPKPKWDAFNDALDELFVEGKIQSFEEKNRQMYKLA